MSNENEEKKVDMSRLATFTIRKCYAKNEKLWNKCLYYRESNYPKKTADNCFYLGGEQCYYHELNKEVEQ